jgi:probable HAF family extracellular repeat protein
MSRLGLSSAFSHALRRLFHGAPNRRARRAMRQRWTSSRLRLECLESRVLLSSYIIQDLGTLGGNGSEAYAINAQGEVVGEAALANGTVHAVLWAPGQSGQDLGTLGGSNSAAIAINILGEIVGKADTASAQGHPFDLQPGGSMTDLTNGPPSSDLATLLTAKGINDTGVIVGQGSFNLIDLVTNASYSFDPPSGTLNMLNGGNLDSSFNFDEIVSGEATAVAGTRAVANLVYLDHGNQVSLAAVENINTPDSDVPLPAIANQADSYVYGISAPNGSGTQFAVGTAFDTSGNSHALLWTIPTDPHSATVSDLGSLSGTFPTAVWGVNSLGDVVGSDHDTVSGKDIAIVKYHDGSVVSLNSLLPPGSGITLTEATGINDSGQICAYGSNNTGEVRAFLLTPVIPTPPQATLTNAPDINSSGATTYSFVVTYTDANGIDSTTLNNAIQVTGPGGFSQTASLASTAGTSTQLAATYNISAPGGTWDFADNGTYTITLNNNVVKNISGQPLAGGTLGHFVAAIAVKRGSISGTVFNDANGNGQRDPGEGGVPNTDVFLDLNDDGKFDLGDRVTQTDANGNYSFNGLLPGSYRVMELVVAPHAVTSPSNDVHLVNLNEGQNVTGQNFGDAADPQITGIAGQSLAGTPQGQTAQFDQPATVLHVSGVNFAANDIFYFGNDQATASLTNLQTDSNGNQTFDLQVPQLATTGALVVYSPNSNRYTTLLPTFTVDSYRNVNGFSFDNDGKTPDESASEPNFSFDELTKVYGADQTDITVDPCGILTLGLANCTVDTGIPNPLAYLELAIINDALPPSNGECVGFSLTAARLSLGLEASYPSGQYQLGDFPAQTGTDGSTVWDLSNSADLRQVIRLAHLEQTSDEVLTHYVTQIIADEVNGVSNLINDVKNQLAQGLPVPIGLLLPDGGHCVLAYNVQDNPNGSVTLDVYDPDLPYGQSSEEDGTASATVPGVEDGEAHAQAVQRSTITFDSSGHWTYDGGAVTSPASGGLGSISPIPLSLFDSHTLLAANLTSLLTGFVFGSASETQVTDSSGHTLLNADGSPNTNPNTMIPNAARFDLDDGSPPLDLIEGTGSFMQTITGTGSGTYGAASLSSDAMAVISGVASGKGQTDQFGLDPSNDKLTFLPGSTKTLNADLVINAPAGVQREAQLTGTAAGGGTQALQFQGSQRDHVVFNAVGGGTFSLNLTSNANGLVQTFTTGPMTLAAGDSVDVLPSNWADIQGATATIVVTHANGSTTTSTISNGGQGLQVSAKEAVSFTAPVANFTNQTATGKSAVIDWGDGTTSIGTVGTVVMGGTEDVTVSGSHTYAQQGYYPTRITLSDANGPLGQATGEAAVAFNKFTLAPANISAFAGVPFSGTVATMTDIPSGEDASDFGVSINWGDGTTSAGTLQETSPGQFLVRGSHTWAATGPQSVTVTVTENGSASGQGQTLNIGSNTNFSGTVAQLQLPISGSATSDYVATIDWGDGTTSTGTLTLQADGSVILSGSHLYATGNKSYVTHFTLTGGPSASTTSTAIANPAVGTVTGTLFDDLNGNGTMDSGDEGIPDQTVFIDLNNDGKLDPGDPFAVTNSSGVYTISNVLAGNVHVSEILPSGFHVTAPASGSYTVTLNAGQTLSNLNFANTQLAQISGTVFVDANGNGKQDPSEPGLANQIVYLDLSNTGVLGPNDPTAITNSTGAFAFTVNPGSYVVRLQPASDVTITTPAGGAYSVTVGEGGTNSSGLFGVQLPPPPALSPPPPPPVSPPPSPPPSPKPPPTLHTPPLLAFFDSLLAGVETVNGNETETVIDRFFGIPLFISTYDGAGNLMSVTLFGIDVTLLIELL